ncbi:MAG TPA: peptidylprolyl isomerase [Candidatus Saccharimonadia bacterium]|nr:peptidylprolyl isomerase [Candidatus Saccharimonadia bacterium]
MLGLGTVLLLTVLSPLQSPAPAAAAKPPTTAEVIAATKPGDWRALDPERTLYLELDSGRVVIELAPSFAPKHVENIRTLAREGYYDGLAILRAQENYVVQWGDPHAEDEQAEAQADDTASDAKPKARAMKHGARALPPEFVRPAKGLDFTTLTKIDGYAPEAGFSQGFPAGRDPRRGEAWLAHCYAMVGAGRGNTADSGSGAELYVVIGHSPRHLDRNITLVGRVVHGMERLTTLPRGTGPLGFYEQPAQHVPLRSIKVAADVPQPERTQLEVMRTDTPAFAALVESRRIRREEWFLVSTGHVELCNVPLVVRPVAAPR